MRIVQINGGTKGSTGKIMFGIADIARKYGNEVICVSPITTTNRDKRNQDSVGIRVPQGRTGRIAEETARRRREIPLHRRHPGVHRKLGLPLPGGGRPHDVSLHPGRACEDAAPQSVWGHLVPQGVGTGHPAD